MPRALARLQHRPSPVWLAMVLLAGGGCQHSGAGSDSQNAEQIFASVCAKCHGSDGKGGVPAAEGQNPPRNFCDARFQASRSDDDLKHVIREGKGGMPAFGKLFSEAELGALVHRLRSFNPATQGH